MRKKQPFSSITVIGLIVDYEESCVVRLMKAKLKYIKGMTMVSEAECSESLDKMIARLFRGIPRDVEILLSSETVNSSAYVFTSIRERPRPDVVPVQISGFKTGVWQSKSGSIIARQLDAFLSIAVIQLSSGQSTLCN